MNNKGQVLVTFIILLPIFLLVLMFIVDIGLFSIEKRKVSNNTYDALVYYLEYLDEEKTLELLESNLEDIKVNIKEEDNYINITTSKEYNGIFNVIYDNEIIVTYKGNKINKEIIKG